MRLASTLRLTRAVHLACALSLTRNPRLSHVSNLSVRSALRAHNRPLRRSTLAVRASLGVRICSRTVREFFTKHRNDGERSRDKCDDRGQEAKHGPHVEIGRHGDEPHEVHRERYGRQHRNQLVYAQRSDQPDTSRELIHQYEHCGNQNGEDSQHHVPDRGGRPPLQEPFGTGRNSLHTNGVPRGGQRYERKQTSHQKQDVTQCQRPDQARSRRLWLLRAFSLFAYIFRHGHARVSTAESASLLWCRAVPGLLWRQTVSRLATLPLTILFLTVLTMALLTLVLRSTPVARLLRRATVSRLLWCRAVPGLLGRRPLSLPCPAVFCTALRTRPRGAPRASAALLTRCRLSRLPTWVLAARLTAVLTWLPTRLTVLATWV